MAAKRIRVLSETKTGLNVSFNVPGQGRTPRSKLIQEIAAGRHEGYHTRTNSNGTTYVASNPDGKSENNLG